MENTVLDFEYSYDNNAAGSFLVIKLDSESMLLKHQVEILCQNPNSAFVSFHVRRENDNTFIYYNITSKISLSNYIERKSFNRKELLDLLRSIAKNLMLTGNYLLELSGFIIHPDYIFINPATAEASLLYVPVSCNRNSTEILKSFFKDIVINSSNTDDNARDNYLQRILNYLKSDTFSLIDFNRLIVDLRNSGEVYEYGQEAANQEADVGIGITCSRSPKEKIYEDAGKSSNIRSIMLLQPIFLIAAAAVCLYLISRKMGDIVSITGVVIISAALDILVINRISGNQDKRAATDNTQLIAQDKAKRSTGRHDKDLKGRYKPVLSSPDVVKACDTEYISEVPKDCRPYLESIGPNRVEKVIVNKDSFIIGRLGSMADHIIQESTIGKLHAEITINEGLYYIRDLNSKNGTFVNGVRIPSNRKYGIKDNDRIRLSNYEYVFRKQEEL
ncbi:MAG TPA: DUF6382 domain-containing protein [Bacillota bacterium]|nr:DUF6382 domain-containing protein [Bacillota bacterium]HQE65309.1 DUF6382 domain-containing protein [Bacillota bacterium]HQI15491.1 DUF6382 domain-containing protein [Bacillota bacterium]HQL35830.1 DUF6382 domain-containing protein [Bacillota bacterium]HRS20674.1 DUF6382 domain-containing protein [Clostridia bacterium]